MVKILVQVPYWSLDPNRFLDESRLDLAWIWILDSTTVLLRILDFYNGWILDLPWISLDYQLL